MKLLNIFLIAPINGKGQKINNLSIFLWSVCSYTFYFSFNCKSAIMEGAFNHNIVETRLCNNIEDDFLTKYLILYYRKEIAM